MEKEKILYKKILKREKTTTNFIHTRIFSLYSHKYPNTRLHPHALTYPKPNTTCYNKLHWVYFHLMGQLYILSLFSSFFSPLSFGSCLFLLPLHINNNKHAHLHMYTKHRYCTVMLKPK